MNKTAEKIRILAPSGSIEQLVAAVNNGCDAVYLGLDSFNARMKAPNFTLENLSEWVDYCHIFGVRVYVAINTSLKNCEFMQAVELLLRVYNLNADGVIVTDVALMRIAGSLPKPFDVVASTQLNVHDKYGAEFVKKCGATTVVCARECSLDEIREIASTGIAVECFIHGAMCVSQSGQCLFSSMVGGNSGNRGLCAQPCRKVYFAEGATDTKGYLLSARDMCGLDIADKLAEAGATTFKIEGRNRRAEYAGLTSRIYRRLFDSGCMSKKDDYELLAEVFNRSMAPNRYLFGKNSDIIYKVTQNHIGVEVGTVKGNCVEAYKELCKGDGLKIFDGDKEVCGGVVLESGRGLVKAQFGGKVSEGMRVCRTTSIKLRDEVLSARKKLNVDFTFTASVGKYPEIVAYCNGVKASFKGDFVVEKADNSPISDAEICNQLRKSGNTYYTICDIDIKTDDIFIAKSQLNALRRGVLDILSKRLIENYNEQFSNRKEREYDSIVIKKLISNSIGTLKRREKSFNCVVICTNEQQLQQAKLLRCKTVYKPDCIDRKSIDAAIELGAYIDLPSFADLNYLSECSSELAGAMLLCNNVGQVEFARSCGFKYIAGCGLNIFNDYIACEFSDSDSFVYSRELTIGEIEEFVDARGLTFVDGQIPLMQLCHCPYKAVFNCDCSNCKSGEKLSYRDELGNRFVIKRRQAGRCLFELVNGKKMSVVNKLKTKGNYLMDFDEAVVCHYKNLNDGFDDGYTEMRPYTKGRLYDKIN